jgi:hypothetical protein
MGRRLLLDKVGEVGSVPSGSGTWCLPGLEGRGRLAAVSPLACAAPRLGVPVRPPTGAGDSPGLGGVLERWDYRRMLDEGAD